MKRELLLENIAPCSLMCHTCSAFQKGVICETAGRLLHYMDGVTEFYEKHSPREAESFEIFHKELEKFSVGYCPGCRNEGHNECSIKGCFLLKCTREHSCDFCGECPEFPCSRTRSVFEDEVYAQWLAGNQEIKENGIEAFWEKNKTRPHYKAYKPNKE